MPRHEESIEDLMQCTCFENNTELELDDLQDADLCDPSCPIHGEGLQITSEE